ncbi:MAG: metallophosphoesterase [Lachnospiraceae bacterium]|nr:metallophosphoesterase [Lachnospiraceae bacterium]
MKQKLNPDKAYFAISDIHSYYWPMRSALKEAGFDETNPDHILIVCGDIFDRGPDTLKVYNFLRSLPKDRRILIRGNHESLLLDLIDGALPHWTDYSNGTLNTLCHLTEDLTIIPEYFIIDRYWGTRYPEEFNKYWPIAKKKAKESEVIAWLKSDEWIDYLELDKYIFVHSFIPVKHIDDKIWDAKNMANLKPMPRWRNAGKQAWERATWGCPYLQFAVGLFETEIQKGKVLVCGHWHTRDFHSYFSGKGRDNNQLYFSENLIGLDGCTAGTLNTNVLVIKDNKCFDKFGKELTNG